MNSGTIRKARLHLVSALFIVILLAVACGGGDEPEATPTSAPTSAPTVAATVTLVEQSESPLSPIATPAAQPQSPLPAASAAQADAPVQVTVNAAALTFIREQLRAPENSMATWQELMTTGKLLFLNIGAEGQQTYLVDASEIPRPLFPEIDVAVEAMWSPDGTQIVFTGNDEKQGYKIYLANADGSNARKLMDEQPGYNFRPSWIPDGNHIFFMSNRDNNLEIYEVNVDGTGLTNLTNHEGNDSNPNLSPDGSTIAFVSDRLGYPSLFFMDADGSHVRQVVDEKWRPVWPHWSPDGSRLLFASDHEGASHFYTLAGEGSEPQLVTKDAGDHIEPYWLDNERVIYATGYGVAWDLYVMNVDDGSVIQLTDTPGPSERYPSWIANQ